MDSEFCILQDEISNASDFQLVLRAHRNFINNVIHLSCIDNILVQEGIDRVLHVCLRFISICRLLQQQEEKDMTIGWSSRPIPPPTKGGFQKRAILSIANTNITNISQSKIEGNLKQKAIHSNTTDENSLNHATKKGDEMNDRRTTLIPVIISPEEIEVLRKDLFTQISYLFQIMRKIENKGFMFRLDYNCYLSSLANELGAVIEK